MTIFGKLFGRGAGQAAGEPQEPQKPSAFADKEIAPRAHAAGRKARTAYEALRSDWQGSREEAEPAEDEGAEAMARRAGRFLGKLHNRLNQDPDN